MATGGLYLPPEFVNNLSQGHSTTISTTSLSVVKLVRSNSVNAIVKELRPGGSSSHDHNFRARLERAAREWARAAAQLPNNVQFLFGLCVQNQLPSFVAVYVGRSLRDHLRDTIITREEKYIILSQIASALNGMHAANPPIVHTNLKCSNILIGQNKNVFICDIGVHDVLYTPGQLSPSVRWQAPEKLQGNAQFRHTKECDVWSFGMTCLEVMTAREPFAEIQQNVHVVFSVAQGIRPQRPVELTGDDLWDLLALCWEFTPSRRVNMGYMCAVLYNKYQRSMNPW